MRRLPPRLFCWSLRFAAPGSSSRLPPESRSRRRLTRSASLQGLRAHDRVDGGEPLSSPDRRRRERRGHAFVFGQRHRALRLGRRNPDRACRARNDATPRAQAAGARGVQRFRLRDRGSSRRRAGGHDRRYKHSGSRRPGPLPPQRSTRSTSCSSRPPSPALHAAPSPRSWSPRRARRSSPSRSWPPRL